MARDILQTIRHLMALAESAGSKAEAENASARAEEMIARYGIDAALLDAEKKEREEVGDRRFFVEAPYATDKVHLLNCVYSALGCRVVITKKEAKGQWLSILGFTADMERAEILYTSLLIQALRWMRDEVSEYEWDWTKKPRQTLAADRRAWLLGFSTTVYRRIKAAEDRAKASAGGHITSSGKSTDLVLVERSALVTRKVEEMFPGMRKGKSRNLSGRGYSNGRAAGERANIGQRGISAGRRALAGS